MNPLFNFFAPVIAATNIFVVSYTETIGFVPTPSAIISIGGSVDYDAMVSTNSEATGYYQTATVITVPNTLTIRSFENSSPESLYAYISSAQTINTLHVADGAASLRITAYDSAEKEFYAMISLVNSNTITVGMFPSTAQTNFVPDSLGYNLFTNIIARTNGGSDSLWGTYTLPPTWPNGVPTITRNPNFIFRDVTGVTGYSQCHTNQSARGQQSITLLTRRHAITMGHSLCTGNPGVVNGTVNGNVVYFVTRDNVLVPVTVGASRCTVALGDVTVMAFTEDLPVEIEPVKVVDTATALSKVHTLRPSWFLYYPITPLFAVEQGGHYAGYTTSTGFAPFFNYNYNKRGDSGSPNYLVKDNELVLFGITSGTWTSLVFLQSLVDACTVELGLSPANYQLQTYDLSSYPTYP